MKKIVILLALELVLYSCTPQESIKSTPSVTTGEVTYITATSARCSNDVTSGGSKNATVTVRGVCWSTSPNPTTAKSKTTNGVGLGTFTSYLTGLTPNTTYYVRAYATNSEGTAYGNQKSFKTQPGDPEQTTPTVTTGDVTNITATSAMCAGDVISNGYFNAWVNERGVCWNTWGYPTLDDNKVTAGWLLGPFTVNLTNLIPNTVYYVRAYATNSEGTSYGVQKTFTTLLGPYIPSVTTGVVTNITTTTASYSGNVTSEGGTALTDRGICWNTSGNPTIEDSKTTNGTDAGTFTANLSGLSPYTTYYVRAYAINTEGTAYGQQVIFSTMGEFTDARDERTYKYVRIGEQVWMAENLAYLPKLENLSSELYPSYFVYDYMGTNIDEAKATFNYNTYGVLYNWPAAMNEATSSNTNPSGVQGVCPDGWHLPSNAEWQELLNYLLDNNYSWHKVAPYIAKSMAKESGWESSIREGAPGNAGYPEYRNKSGFSALPGGFFHVALGSEEVFFSIGQLAFWWSSTESTSLHALPVYIGYDSYSVGSGNGYLKDYNFSVRCVKD